MMSYWRMAFIFLPAAIRGDLGSLGLYIPFVFGYLLRELVNACKKLPKIGMKMYTSTGMLGAFLFAVWWYKQDAKSLPNFFISSFVSPMLRWGFPSKGPIERFGTWGDHLVYAMLVLGLTFAWFWQGIDTLFVGFMFLQAVPELQRHFWFKPQIHIFVVSAVILVSLPYVSVGVCAWYFPQYLESFPPAYLRVLCWVANAAPSIVDHYATLGIEKGASDAEIKKAYRRLAGRYHPDKVGDDPVALEAFHKIAEANEALVKPELRKEYDELIGNPELHELTPRCIAFVVMMGYWLLHALIDWNDVEGVREQHKQKLREHILNNGAVDLDALGLDSRDALVEYCQNEENELPFLGDNGREAVMEMRQLLEDAGKDLKDIPEDIDVLKLLPDPKGPQVKGPEDETTASVQKARAQRAWGPKSKDEAKAMKFKMKRYKKMVKKHEGSSCAIS